ncbi:MAG: hypothetical protein ACI865_002734 [Flavobacteriaceae bacterium]|jgi:hypothetical protein
MKWIGERISFVDEKFRTTVVIHPKDDTKVKALMGAWFTMWLTIGATVIWSYFTFVLTEQEQVIIYVFMAFWLYYAVRVGRGFFWLLWGKELLKIDEASVSYKKSIKSYGNAKSYLLENISKIRMYKPEEKSLQAVWEASPWVKGGERIEFDYLGKVVRLGRKLEQRDAELLFKLITKRVQDRLRKMN